VHVQSRWAFGSNSLIQALINASQPTIELFCHLTYLQIHLQFFANCIKVHASYSRRASLWCLTLAECNALYIFQSTWSEADHHQRTGVRVTVCLEAIVQSVQCGWPTRKCNVRSDNWIKSDRAHALSCLRRVLYACSVSLRLTRWLTGCAQRPAYCIDFMHGCGYSLKVNPISTVEKANSFWQMCAVHVQSWRCTWCS